MNRTEKSTEVEILKTKFAKANAAFVTEYRGMSVDKLHVLRKKVREGNGELRVVKNRLAKLAVVGSKFDGLTKEFRGPVAVAFSYTDAVAIAKAVAESVSDTSSFKIRMASIEGKIVDPHQVVALSKLPSREVLLSMMLGALRGPIQNFANVIAAVPRNLANVLTAVKDSKTKQS